MKNINYVKDKLLHNIFNLRTYDPLKYQEYSQYLIIVKSSFVVYGIEYKEFGKCHIRFEFPLSTKIDDPILWIWIKPSDIRTIVQLVYDRIEKCFIRVDDLKINYDIFMAESPEGSYTIKVLKELFGAEFKNGKFYVT